MSRLTDRAEPSAETPPHPKKWSNASAAWWTRVSEPYARMQALLENGPMQGKAVDVEAVEGRPPKTIDVPDEKGGTCRYCLAQWTQEGMTAVYTFLYAV